MPKRRFRVVFRVLLAAQQSILVGGQAIIEGVMMRVPGAYAIAVRNPSGEIITRREIFISLTEKHALLRMPIIRGMIALFESMKMGVKTLNESAEIAFDEAPPEELSFKDKAISFLSTAVALAIGLGLFFVTPLFVTGNLLNLSETAFTFNIVSGIIRIALFLTYLWAISLMSDVKRLFQYHGAEHKTVYTFEAGKTLELESAKPFQTQHPRCGTSFIFIVLLSSILMFAIIDSIVKLFVGEMTLQIRLLTHLPLIPLVAGFSYEVLKLSSRYRHIAWVRALAAPGLWLQNITTREPDDDQLDVAIESLKVAFGDDLEKYQGQEYVAEAID
ncbi:MAG: DUF1385 domain-containing protein [Candidatus Marinimicrobia bacterium]|nr:DUF1385 domain-containing protein [Candidatus Neomarinimicrobiota bacterium]